MSRKSHKFFQWHLGTTLALMITIGCLLWINIGVRRQFDAYEGIYYNQFIDSVSYDNEARVICKSFGWPFMGTIWSKHYRPEVKRWDDTPWEITISYRAIAVDCSVALLILVVVWYFGETCLSRFDNIRKSRSD